MTRLFGDTAPDLLEDFEVFLPKSVARGAGSSDAEMISGAQLMENQGPEETRPKGDSAEAAPTSSSSEDASPSDPETTPTKPPTNFGPAISYVEKIKVSPFNTSLR